MWITLVLFEPLRALTRHKLRSALATLGIAIGVAAVVLVVGVGEAGSARAQRDLENLGDNLVWVEAGSRNVAGVRTGSLGTTSLTLDDAQALWAEVPSLKRMSPQIDGTVQIIAGHHNWSTRYRGEAPDYLAIKKWELAEGSPLSAEDLDASASKIMIGQTVRTQLFGSGPAVGQQVRINQQLFEVAGVLNAKGQAGDGRDQDDWILLPYTTAQAKIRGNKTIHCLDDILFSATSASAVDGVVKRIMAVMRDRHHIAAGQDDDFNIRRPDEVLKAQLEAARTLGLLLITVAAISLLVGGIGIMNVMLASVAMRTREIGLRMAVGATDRAVEVQFLGEATLLSLVGGVSGVGLAICALSGFEQFVGWPITVSTPALLVALASSTTVGLFFGFYPARRAAQMDPITALRNE